MCGIGGILGRDDPALVRAMMGRLAHRGPDGEGLHSDASVTLGHRRLAIIDRASGRQPMTDHSGRWTLTYNGEVYNHDELRRHLQAVGHRFSTHSDTEVVLEAWKQWGPAALDRLDGMFAFALWDNERRELVLARDRWGQKPLHFTWVGQDFLWASEAKAFAAHPGFAFQLDEGRLRLQAVLEHLGAGDTLFQGVAQLPPGTWACVRQGRLQVQAYGGEAPARLQDPAAAAQQLAQALRRAVASEAEAEVPVATVLSGGLDSAIVAAVHQQVAGTVHTFTVADAESVADFQAARQVADAIGTVHHERTFGVDDLVRDLPTHVAHQENVSYTEAFFFPLFRFMRPHAPVALCGQAADEFWGGYARYRDPAAHWAERQARAARLGVDVSGLEAAHASGAALARHDQGDQLASFQLRLVDRAGMAHGVEVRAPLLDSGVTALAAGAPWDWKLRDGTEKWLLRQAARRLGVPRVAVERPKLPAGRATAPGANAQFEQLCSDLLGTAWQGHRLGPCFANAAEAAMFLLWEEVFVVRRGDARGVTVEDVLALGVRA